MGKRECLYFERGALFSGALKYVIWELKECMLLESKAYNGFRHMENMNFTFPKDEMKRFTSIMNLIAKWDKDYQCSEEILDGYGWVIKYEWDRFHIHTKGYEASPEGYKNAVYSLQNIIEELCSKYADNYVYVMEEVHDRLSL